MPPLVVILTDTKLEEMHNQGTGYAWGQVTLSH